MGQIALAEGHEEADSFYARDIFCKSLNFFMVKKVHILLAYLIEVIFPFDRHWRNFYPVAVFPVRAGSGYLAEVDFRIEVGCKRISVVAAVAVQNINRVNFIEIVFLCIGCKNAGDARVKAGSEKTGDAGFLETVHIGPLPGVIKVSRKAKLFASLFVDRTPCRIIRVFCFVVCSINVRNLTCKAGIHNGKILIRKSQI